MAAPSPSPILISASRYTLSPGDNLRLSGRFLSNATRVEIGGVLLSVVYNSGSEIIVAIPSPAPSGICRVTTPGGSGTLARAFKPEPAPNTGSSSGGSAPPPSSPSPSQQGAAAGAAYDAAYNAAKNAAESAYSNAGGDTGGTAAHVAAQTAAQAAARQAAGPGQSGAARQAGSAAYNDFKTSLLTTGNGPNPGGAGSPGADGSVQKEGLSQLIFTMQQWIQVLPEPLRAIATAVTGILDAARRMGASFPAKDGPAGKIWESFKSSMDEASKKSFNDLLNANGGGGRALSPVQERLKGAMDWAGKGIGDFAGKMGLVNSEGVVPPEMAKAIVGGIGLLLLGAINNIKGAYTAGVEASNAYTNGLRSGFGAVEEAARDLTNRVVSALMQPFGASGGGVASGVSGLIGGMSSFVTNMAGLGSQLRSTILGIRGAIVSTALAGLGGLIGTLGGPVGIAIGVFLGATLGLIGTKIVGVFNGLMGQGFEVIGKVAGEIFKAAGAVVDGFVKVMADCTQAAMEFAHTARTIANRTGFSDSSASGISWALQGLGLSSNEVRGMFGSAENGQFNRALTGAAWGVRGMPVSGDFESNDYLSSVYERARQLKQSMGPLGAQFQQMFLNSTGNGAMLDAVNLSPTAFYERQNFAKQFPGMSGENVGRFEEDFGTLMAEWQTFTNWLKISFGTELLPTLKLMFSGVVGWVQQNKTGIVDAIKGAASWVWVELPSLVLTGLKVLVVGASNIATLLGNVLGAVGSNLPAILKGVEGLINGFRDLIAMGVGFAAVASDFAKNGWTALLRFRSTYQGAQSNALQMMPAANANNWLSPRQQILLGQTISQNGAWLQSFGNSTTPTVARIDALMNKFSPQNQAKSNPVTNPLLQQIANNTAQTAQNTANIGQDVGDATSDSLKRAIADIIGVSLRHSSRDLYYAARRA